MSSSVVRKSRLWVINGGGTETIFGDLNWYDGFWGLKIKSGVQEEDNFKRETELEK